MLSDSDEELIEAARAILKARFKPGRHAVGSALRTRSGRIHVGLNVECYVTRISICAEAVAIGRASVEGDGDEIETIVAVRQASADDARARVVSPCGMCREMISDYAPGARVIVPEGSDAEVVPVASLLPNKYVRP
jgi:cytidine deaminase